MKALVYHGPHDFRLEDRPIPKAGPGEAVVKVILSTICGTELHMLHGSHDAKEGVVLGHEPVGIVHEIGEGVHGFEVGDRVAISCITRCGQCYFCQQGLFSHCEKGGWVMGYQIDGSHAEYMRVPYAELSLYKIPDNVKTEEVGFVTDALSTGYLAAENGQIQPGDVVAVYGAGPIGISTMACAKLWSPKSIIMVDQIEERLALAKQMGADEVVNAKESDPIQFVKNATQGRGADVTIEAIGNPITLNYALGSVRMGGHVSVIGVFDGPVEVPMDKLWEMNIQIRTGLLTTANIPRLIDLIAAGKIDLSRLLTHTFPLERAIEGFDLFDKREGGVMKVGLIP